MSLERYAKAGIISGIVLIGATIAFGLAPDFINRYDHYFENFEILVSEEDVHQKYLQSTEYKAFSERYPEHDVEFWYNNNDSKFGAVAYNAESGNALVLSLRYNAWDDEMRKDVECSAIKRLSGVRYNANDLLVTPFIKATDCLD